MKYFVKFSIFVLTILITYKLMFCYSLFSTTLIYTKQKVNNVYIFPYTIFNPLKSNDLKQKVTNYCNKIGPIQTNKPPINSNQQNAVFILSCLNSMKENGFTLSSLKEENNEKHILVSSNSNFTTLTMVFIMKENEIVSHYI